MVTNKLSITFLACAFAQLGVRALESQAQAQLYLQQGVEANSQLAASISVEKANRMMRETTMPNPFSHPEEISIPNWINFGILAAMWIVGLIFAVVVLCSSESPSRDENSPIPSVAAAAQAE